MDNKETKKYTTPTHNISFITTIVLAALKLDRVLDISWFVVICPIIVDTILDLITSFMVWILFAVEGICKSIRKNNYNNHTFDSIHWDYKTQNFYDATGNKIDNTVENEEEQDY